MILLDLSHTAHTRARTGIQRVARALQAELAARGAAVAVTWDPFAGAWRELDAWENANLAATAPSDGRGAKWTAAARWRGRWRKFLDGRPTLPLASGAVVPELFSPTVARALPRLPAAGPRVALFHDAIALKFPELTPAKTVARYPAYLQELQMFDGIAAVSEDSRQTLLDYWRWLGVADHPPVVTLPLGLTPAPAVTRPAAAGDAVPPRILSVGSLEGRKNHVALLDAGERLWADGRRFSLRLIGLAHPQTGRAALDRIAALQSAGRDLRYDGAVDEATLEAAYADCDFTVYPSLMEGFGLPVLESVARGKPCICSDRGALAEAARPGGCQLVDTTDVGELARAIDAWLADPAARTRAAEAARQRTFRTWKDYTDELLGWMQSLG